MPRFTPPTHEEPMRTGVRPLCYFRLTWAKSVVRVNGTFTSLRSPAYETLLAAGVEGLDYFLGGKTYSIDDATATQLEAAGFTVDHTEGYGIGPFGQTPYGE